MADGKNPGAATPTLKQLTPVLIVDEVEPCVKFWTDRLGFDITNKVPADDGKLIFASVQLGSIEIMYQTVASITGDTVASASDKKAFRLEPQQATLYIEVGDLGQVESKLRGERQVMPRRKTFYGAAEIGYADPAGNIVIFSEHAES